MIAIIFLIFIIIGCLVILYPMSKTTLSDIMYQIDFMTKEVDIYIIYDHKKQRKVVKFMTYKDISEYIFCTVRKIRTDSKSIKIYVH